MKYEEIENERKIREIEKKFEEKQKEEEISQKAKVIKPKKIAKKPKVKHIKKMESKVEKIKKKVAKKTKKQDKEFITKAQKEESIEEEIERKEKEMDYEDTPFYLRQDRPVFTGKESKIPTSPSARALHFGALGISIVGGTISAALKQNLGISKPLPEVAQGRRLARYAMTNSNSERLSNTLCKMRGAALKIGQILSNTEESFLPKSIQQAFDKARQRANIMPKYQVTQMLERELGPDWQNSFREFSLYPLAAASIGQVHSGTINDGTKVAVKIQYPNIAESIDSDFANFKRLLKVIGAAPDSLYLDDLFRNVKAELHEE